MDRPAVLIVDDMEVNRDILSFYFRKEYTVLGEADGEEAIDTIKKYTDRIALVFLDFYMPGKSGLDVLSFMQTDNYRPTLHVVHCTEQEAEIHIPFCHKEYDEQEKQARKRFHVYERSWRDAKYWEDPDYPFDWTEGEFC